MIRKLVLKRRLQSAPISSHQFLAPNTRLSEQAASNCAHSTIPDEKPSSGQLKQLIEARRARADFFGAHLYADTAWDILLQAYIATLDEERLLLSTLLRTSLVPATTTLRWIKALEQDGWLDRVAEPLESPQSCVSLSIAGRIGMQRYLTAVWPFLAL